MDQVDDRTLIEMVRYYRARAPEYDQWFLREGRYDLGPVGNAEWRHEVAEVVSLLDNFDIQGDVVELAGGSGLWTQRFVQNATSLTVVDASPEMLALNRERVADERVTYVVDDLFCWSPARAYDAVCFGFWLSHVPKEKLDGFLRTASAALVPGGKVFFVDSKQIDPAHEGTDPEVPPEDGQLQARTLADGREFRIVKNYLEPGYLASRFRRAGFEVEVRETAHYFIHGYGRRVPLS